VVISPKRLAEVLEGIERQSIDSRQALFLLLKGSR
jgi:hypothetical protein